jgi:CspA family cold shock protein
MGAKESPLVGGRHTQHDEDASAEVFEVSGSVKWFDPSKGFGFIVPDEDLLT